MVLILWEVISCLVIINSALGTGTWSLKFCTIIELLAGANRVTNWWLDFADVYRYMFVDDHEFVKETLFTLLENPYCWKLKCQRENWSTPCCQPIHLHAHQSIVKVWHPWTPLLLIPKTLSLHIPRLRKLERTIRKYTTIANWTNRTEKRLF